MVVLNRDSQKSGSQADELGPGFIDHIPAEKAQEESVEHGQKLKNQYDHQSRQDIGVRPER